jgi:uncharacterized protein (DUF488 family)
MGATATIRQLTAPAQAGPSAVFSIGYEGKQLAGFIEQLVSAHVAQLLDVRCNAISRKKGFGKRQLMQACMDCNIQYIHIPELGIPSQLRTALKTKEDYKVLMKHYQKHLLPEVSLYVQQVAQFAAEKSSAFMCFEQDINCCHRKPLVDAISKVTGLPVTHL